MKPWADRRASIPVQRDWAFKGFSNSRKIFLRRSEKPVCQARKLAILSVVETCRRHPIPIRHCSKDHSTKGKRSSTRLELVLLLRKQAVAAGVKCVEHGQLIDESTAKLLADKGIWWSLQPFLDDEDVLATLGPVSRKKALEVFAGTDNAYKFAKKYNIKTAFGTDLLFDAKIASRQGAQLAKLVRWYTPAEALKMATADNGQLMALSGFINPYPGKLGVVEEGALADLLLVDGNPLENIKLIEDPDKNFPVIMKNGIVYKNTVPK